MIQVTMIYPATLTPDESGRLLVQFPDLPEALTDGASLSEALLEAADCLTVALAGRVMDRGSIPLPSPLAPGMVAIHPDETIALKASLHRHLQTQGLRTADLARLLNIGHKEARRLLDPKHATKLPALAAALHALGGNVAVTVSFPEAAE